jgi:hypothetical protein
MIMTQNAMIRSLVWNLRLVGSWGSVWPAITNLRRSVEAQNQIVADCRRDWRNLLDAVSRAVATEPTPDHVAGVLADMLNNR